ncbi:MAG: globin domain-containing protein [Galactobacter sp.]|uniref:globin domain-containing protein n=1 Tax=Galactobacter sp. TaxID=2676125 RepID=UPI0025BE1AF9|nr:globin domain-containing protein [Galactobacter sp.]
MLSQASRPLIEATLPTIAERIVDITTDFYSDMLGTHPELLDGVFSRANQSSGEQAKALASSIAVFAQHLLAHPDTTPERMLARIAHKHTSLGILPEQYQIVHDHLFGAIAKNLEGIITDEIAAAWEEVYWLMANALIKLEKGLYAEQANDKIWAPWRVAEKALASTASMAFALEPADDTPITPALPGQYVSIRVLTEDGLRQARQYSLTGSGAERGFIVKRDEDGEISPILHDRIQEGDVIEVSNPYGELVLSDSDRPLVLATAGIGCTPTASMLEALAASGTDRKVLVLHAEGDLDSWALSEQTQRVVASLPNAELHVWLERPGEATLSTGILRKGFMNLSQIDLPKDAEVFVCGPLPFMRIVREQAITAGVPAAQIDYEVFGPDVWAISDVEPAAA